NQYTQNVVKKFIIFEPFRITPSMKNSLLLIIFLISSVCTANAHQKQLDSVLHVLDKVIQDKDIYTAKNEGRIDSIKTRLHAYSDVKDQIAITKEICLHYIVFMTDSALLYTRKLEKYALQANDYEEYIDSELFRVRILKPWDYSRNLPIY